MTERPVKPANMPWLTPYLIVRDPERSLDFYQRAFGFIPDSQPLRDGSGKIVHAEMSYRDAYLMLGAEGAMGGTKKAPASSGVECPMDPISTATTSMCCSGRRWLPAHSPSWNRRRCSGAIGCAA